MKQYQCRVMHIRAFRQTEADGDEIYLKLNGKKIWPQTIGFTQIQENPLPVNYVFHLEQLDRPVDIELWEYDSILFSSKLGFFPLRIDSTGGPFTTDLRHEPGSHARYSITWEVTLKNVL